MRIAIVGLGGIGSIAAWYLARLGHDVVGLEQFRIDHDRGGSFGGSRIIRHVYPDVFYTRLAMESYGLWAEIEAAAGESLLLGTGGLFLAPAGHETAVSTRAALTEAGVPFESLNSTEVMHRFPAFRLDPEECGLFDPGSGLLRASRCVLASAALARAAGAEFREEARVRAVGAGTHGVRLDLEDGSALSADAALISAGPWTRALLAPHVALPTRATRQVYAHLRPAAGRSAEFEAGRFPIWIDHRANMYGFPRHDLVPGVKLATHDLGAAVDPDLVEREITESDREALRGYAARRLPGLTAEVVFEKTCLYDNTPDEDFVLDLLPGEPRLCVAAGTSGHGFKFLPALALRAADLVAGNASRRPEARFAVTRFGPPPAGREAT